MNPANPSRPTTRRTRARDFVDLALESWRLEQPELNLEPAEIFERLFRISQAFEKEADALCSEFGVSYWAFSVLVALRRGGEPYQLTPTELYRVGMVTSGGMTKRLINLEADGLIERVPAEEDRRSVYVRLTRKGQRLVDEITPQYLDMQADFLGPLGTAQRADLAERLRALLIGLEGAAGPAQD